MTGFSIRSQPTDTSCGPTCLHAVYSHWGDSLDLGTLIDEIPALEQGGTLAVVLGVHALSRGYRAKIYTYNLQTFDPTWFAPGIDISERLSAQKQAKPEDPRLASITDAYLEFLARGGEICLEDLTDELLARHLSQGRPIIAGTSSTYLYSCAREWGPDDIPDDVRGHPQGHFVVLVELDAARQSVTVADPYEPNPMAADQMYEIALSRVISSVMLGILTYDANLLVIEPGPRDT